MTATYSQIYYRLLQEDEAMKAQGAAKRRETYKDIYKILGDVKDNVLKPLGHYTWQAAKGVGRGIKTTAGSIGSCIKIYSDAQKYYEMEVKLNEGKIGWSDPRTTAKNLDDAVKNAERELREEKGKYETFIDQKRRANAQSYFNTKKAEYATATTKKEKCKRAAKIVGAGAKVAWGYICPNIPSSIRDGWSKLLPKITYANKIPAADRAPFEAAINPKATAYENAKRAAPGILGKILETTANADRFRDIKTMTDRMNEKGIEMTPLQLYALFKGEPKKYEEFAKPKDKKSGKFEAPLYDINMNPIKTKVKDPVTGIEIEEEVKLSFNTPEEWGSYIDRVLSILVKKGEMDEKGKERLRRDSVYNSIMNDPTLTPAEKARFYSMVAMGLF